MEVVPGALVEGRGATPHSREMMDVAWFFAGQGLGSEVVLSFSENFCLP